jgi:hypothetical protein
VTVRVVTYAPTLFAHCQHCEVTFGEIGLGERIRREEAATALPSDLALDYARASDWVRRIVERYGGAIHVDVIDAASVQGFVVSLRHRLWRHPAVVVDGQTISGADYVAAERLIEERLETEAGGGDPNAAERRQAEGSMTIRGA